MNGVFYGTIQKVDELPGRLVIRCVRDYFHGDGLMSDDVWIWEIEHPENGKITLLQTMIGRAVEYFEVREVGAGQSLLISIDEGAEAFSVSGTRIGKKEEARAERDLAEVVEQMSEQFRRAEADHLTLSRKLTAIATFIEQKIERIRRRAEFEEQRKSGRPEGLSREIEDLETILRKLKEPNQTPDPNRSAGSS